MSAEIENVFSHNTTRDKLAFDTNADMTGNELYQITKMGSFINSPHRGFRTAEPY